MSRNLQPYQRALSEAEADLKVKLANGRASAGEVAIARRTWEIMAAQLRSSPDSVLIYERLPADPRTGEAGAQRWLSEMRSRAENELFPARMSPAAAEAYFQKRVEYLELAQRFIQSPNMMYQSLHLRRTGLFYLYRENPLVLRITRVIATELVRWFDEYPVDREFFRRGWYLRWSAEEGMLLFLKERPDILVLLRIAQTLPYDTEVFEVPVERPDNVEAMELMIGLIPVVGTLVSLYEAWAGFDLFEYKLTGTERLILAASCLLPLAGRLVKGGRALYTESRLVAMYGRDAAAWSRTLHVSGLATESVPALRVIEEAETAFRTQRSLDRALAQKAAQELPNVVRASAAVSSTVDQAITDLFRQLSSKHGILKSLDELALQRVLAKGPNVDHLKGQLLEELVEARVVPWLRDRAGSFALGVQTGSKQLEFIPGHLIRGADGRQITDGILAFRNNGVLEIAAIFEAKAGQRAARELSLASGSLSSLLGDQLAELRAPALHAPACPHPLPCEYA